MPEHDEFKKGRIKKNSKNHLIAVIAGVLFVGLIFFSGYIITSHNNDVLHNINTETPQEDEIVLSTVAESGGPANPVPEDIESNIEPVTESGSDRETQTMPVSEPDTEDEPELLTESEPEPEPEFTKVAYLTFDDGPSREVTPGILDLLAEEGISATFFVLPRIDVDDIFMRIIDEGHQIGNHSYSHNFRRLYSSGIDSFKNDLIRAHEHLIENYGYTSNIYRFPGGSMSWRNDTIKARIELLDEHGYTFYDWHIDSGDANSAYADKGSQALAGNVLNNTNDRDHVIILLHDFRWRQSTLEALPIIIDGLRDQGYKFDIISNYPG